MRDIGWICKFINESDMKDWKERYFWSLRILAIEGVNYLMADSIEANKLVFMKEELIEFIYQQV